MAGVIGILIVPWRLLEMYQTWLIGYSGLLGVVGGVIVCDYVLIRGGRLALRDLYEEGGAYAYRSGFNPAALIAMLLGILVAMAGKLAPGLGFLFDGAWFSAATVAFIAYYWLMRSEANRLRPTGAPSPAAAG